MLDTQATALNRTLTNELVSMAPEATQVDWMRCKRIFRAFSYVGKEFVLWEFRNKFPTKIGTIKVLSLNFDSAGYLVTVRLTTEDCTRVINLSHEIATLIPGKLLACIPPVMVVVKRADKRYPQFQLLFKTEGGSETHEGELCMSDSNKFEDMVMEAGL